MPTQLPKVLLVDDRDLNLQLLTATLEDMPLETVLAHTGELAVELAKEHEFAVVLMDVHMPGINGFEAARQLRALPDREHVPLIFVTANERQELRLEGYETGAVDYLIKPFNILLLKAKVQVFLDLYNQRQLITDQSRAIAEAYANKSRFFAQISHELRTPLNAILGFSDLMRTGKVGQVAPEHGPYLEEISGGARHLLHLINELLDLAKLDQDMMTFDVQSLDAKQLVDEVCESLAGIAGKKAINIATQIDAGMGQIHADPRRFRQIIYNYLSNAIKFSAKGEQIMVSLCLGQQGCLRIEVADTGPGISPEDQQDLFQEFRQIRRAGMLPNEGSGLGLAITKSLVETQGGRVGVSSELGQGSVFWAELPNAHKPECADDS